MSQLLVINLKNDFLGLGKAQEKAGAHVITVGGDARFPTLSASFIEGLL